MDYGNVGVLLYAVFLVTYALAFFIAFCLHGFHVIGDLTASKAKASAVKAALLAVGASMLAVQLYLVHSVVDAILP